MSSHTDSPGTSSVATQPRRHLARRDRGRPLWTNSDPRRWRSWLLLSLPLLALIGLWWFLAYRNFHNLTRVVPRKDASLALYGTTPRKALLWTLTEGLGRRPIYSADTAGLPFDELRLWIDRDKLRALVADLPDSARQYQRGFLLEGGEAKEVQIRYRGDLPTNWMWPTKSWRVRLKKNDARDGRRILNLKPVPQEMQGFVADLAIERSGYPLLGQRLVRLYVNNEYKGLFREFPQVNETYVRNLGFMPGDVFVGENIGRDYLPRVHGNVFTNSWYWSKAASNNHVPPDHRAYLDDLFDAVAAESHAALYRLIDRENFVDAWAVTTLIGSGRMNNLHNWRLYFDPLDGRFKMLLYDSAFGNKPDGSAEVVSNRLLYVLLRDPRFVADVNARLLEHLRDGLLGRTAERLRELADTAADSRLPEDGFVASAREYAGRLEERERTLETDLRRAELVWTRQGERLTVFYKGLLPLRLAVSEGFALSRPGAGDAESGPLRVYPGRYHLPGLKKKSEQGWSWPIYSRTELRVATTGTITPGELELSARLEGLDHPVTAREAGVDETRSFDLDTLSIDPATWAAPPGRVVRFAGDQRLTEDLLIGPADRLIVAPGSRLFLDEGVSIVIRSAVDLDRVEFTGDPRRPWGVVALHGSGARDSTIRSCRFEHGSHDTVDHVYYSGMLSIHGVPRASVSRCEFGSNFLGDDTLRVGASTVDLLESSFVGARSDAVDYDLSTGTIAGNRFDTSGNDAIDVMTSRVEIRGNRITASGDKGISVGEKSNVLVLDNVIERCLTGIEIKDGSLARAANNVLAGNDTAVHLYWKNWRYGTGGNGLIARSIFHDNRLELDVERRSRLVLDGCVGTARLTDADAARMRVRELAPVPTYARDALTAALEVWVPSPAASLANVFERMGLSHDETAVADERLQTTLPGETTSIAEFLRVRAPMPKDRR